MLKNKQNSNVKNTYKTKTFKLLHSLAYQMTHKSGHQMLGSIKYKNTHIQVRTITSHHNQMRQFPTDRVVKLCSS